MTAPVSLGATATAPFVRLVSGVRDRVRPWRAGDPSRGARTALVIGAGAAGLATAALLRRAGVAATIVDARGEPGGAWPSRYDSLRLNTVRWMSDLPGLRLPRAAGRWVGRDDVTAYLQRYAVHHGLDVEGATVDRLDRADDGIGWVVRIGGTTRSFDAVVVATGHSKMATVPDWDGRDEFRGRVLHSSDYRRPADHLGRRVLVVGAGSSGGEVCVDLMSGGLRPVWSVRSAPHIFPREVARVPSTPFGPIGDLLPAPVLDRLAPHLERLVYGRRDYLPPVPASLTRLLDRGKEPMTADGIVAGIRRSEVVVVPAVERLTASGAMLVDGSHVEVDDIIAGTGYRSGLEELVGHLGVLDGDRPRAVVPLPGLAFVGFRIPLTGTLWAVEVDARRAARSIADHRGSAALTRRSSAMPAASWGGRAGTDTVGRR